MGSPANLRLHSDALLRMFTVTEANALIARLEESFLRLDPKLARLRELRELIADAEPYYGEGLAAAPAREREAYAESLQEQAAPEPSVQADADDAHALRPRPRVLHRAQAGGRQGRRENDAHRSGMPRVRVHPPGREAEARAASRRQRGHGEHRLGSPVDARDDVRDREEAVRLGHLISFRPRLQTVPNLDILSPISSGLQSFRGWPGT